ncbi:MAG: phosphoenolpyruvate--protein phosphotransferase [Balneolia bacterium]|nr:phosphoenolpyruvate--protein phosphotransferase [Balneolia bacterium]
MYIIEEVNGKNNLHKGVASAEGLAVGKSFIFNPQGMVLSQRKITSSQVNEEQQKVVSALRIVELETRKLAQLSAGEEGDDQQQSVSAAILEFHREVLRDPMLIAEINERIRTDLMPGDRAVFQVFRNYIQKLEVSGSRMFRERIPDIVDIRSRLISNLQQKEMIVQVEEGTIVVCREINPSEIILFARKKVGGLVAERGGLTTHASIIAKSLGIPFVLEVEGITEIVKQGEEIVVDGYKGIVISSPTETLIESVKKEIANREILRKEEQKLHAEPGMTACGHKVPLRVNLELEAEIDRVKRFNPEGIGLLRTEAFFLDSGDYENGRFEGHDQIRFLQRSAELAGESELTVRLYDVGGDKLPSFSAREENPALGWRGVRILLDKRALLHSQLEMIIKTLHKYPCKTRVMVPMITNLEEVIECRREFDEVMKGYPAAKIDFGVMIEVPSAALLASDIAPWVDFMSIGTNDLTQYTLAADRGNSAVFSYYNSLHPAVFRLIGHTAKACAEHDTTLSVCGEMAANPGAAAVLVGMGVDSLSMSAPNIPQVKKVLRLNTLALLEKTAVHILKCKTVSEVEDILREIKTP